MEMDQVMKAQAISANYYCMSKKLEEENESLKKRNAQLIKERLDSDLKLSTIPEADEKLKLLYSDVVKELHTTRQRVAHYVNLNRTMAGELALTTMKNASLDRSLSEYAKALAQRDERISILDARNAVQKAAWKRTMEHNQNSLKAMKRTVQDLAQDLVLFGYEVGSCAVVIRKDFCHVKAALAKFCKTVEGEKKKENDTKGSQI